MISDNQPASITWIDPDEIPDVSTPEWRAKFDAVSVQFEKTVVGPRALRLRP